MKGALGYIVGLGLGYLAGWALNESAVVHALIGAGVALWLVGALVGAALLVIGWLFARSHE
jgi:hypothetical protein